MPIHDRSTFESIYAGQAPWDFGRPQKALIDVVDQITGSKRGHKITGIDFLAEPISRAKKKAADEQT